jgi:hypothetical protein
MGNIANGMSFPIIRSPSTRNSSFKGGDIVHKRMFELVAESVTLRGGKGR